MYKLSVIFIFPIYLFYLPWNNNYIEFTVFLNILNELPLNTEKQPVILYINTVHPKFSLPHTPDQTFYTSLLLSDPRGVKYQFGSRKLNNLLIYVSKFSHILSLMSWSYISWTLTCSLWWVEPSLLQLFVHFMRTFHKQILYFKVEYLLSKKHAFWMLVGHAKNHK